MVKVSKHVVSVRHKFKGDNLEVVIMDHTDASQVTLILPWVRLIEGSCRLSVNETPISTASGKSKSKKKVSSNEETGTVPLDAEDTDVVVANSSESED